MVSTFRGDWRRPFFVSILLGAAACARNPTSPTGAVGAEPISTLAAKPSPPAPVPLQVALSGDLGGGGGQVSGTITGSAGAGNLKVSATGTYTLTINTVRIQENAPLQCTTEDQAMLVSEGLIGTPLTGALTLTMDQANDPPMVS